ncbi:MAG: hypothetical protein ACOH5I_07695 [Oligoflexus sp.]
MKIYLAFLSLSLLSACGDSNFRSNNANSELEPSPLGEANLEEGDDVRKVQSELDTSLEFRICAPEKVETVTHRVFFPERNECSFGVGDNLTQLAGHMQAMARENVVIPVEENIILCDLALESTAQDLHYDDYMFFTLNETVLIASEIGWADFFPNGSNNLKAWDWNLVKGQPHVGVETSDRYGVQYCLGDEACLVPKHDEPGPFRYQTNVATVQQGLFQSLEKAKEWTFSLITTGDDDAGDCYHTNYDLTLTIKYMSL